MIDRRYHLWTKGRGMKYGQDRNGDRAMRSRLAAGMMVWLFLGAVSGSAFPREFQANVQCGGSVMALRVPLEGVVSSTLVVSGPGGFRTERVFGMSGVVSVDLGLARDGQGKSMELVDGAYKWELRVNAGTPPEAPDPGSSPGSRTMVEAAGSEQWVATGRFRVEGGSIVAPKEEQERGPAGADALKGVNGQGNSTPLPTTSFADHLYVEGSVCSGCSGGDTDLDEGELMVKYNDGPGITMHDIFNDQRWRWKSFGPLFLSSSRLTGGSRESHVPINH
jgi:hypothetical protein